VYDLEFKYIKETYNFYPSSIKFDDYYLATEFDKLLNGNDVCKINSETEVSDIEQINSKFLYLLKKDMLLSFVRINDVENTIGLVVDAVLYYNCSLYSDIDIKSISNSISEKIIVMNDSTVETPSKIVNLLTYSYNSSYGLIPKYVDTSIVLDSDFYSDGVDIKTNYIIEKLNNTNNNIYFIYGGKGVGKTFLLKYITYNINKDIIFIPINMVEHVLLPEFQKFTESFKDCLFVIEDIEMYVANNYNRNPLLMKTIIQNCTGYLASSNIDYIITANCNDKDIFENELLDTSNFIKLEKISYEKALKVSKKMKSKIKLNKDVSYSLADIKNGISKNKIGF
jgi:hypothetical protein